MTVRVGLVFEGSHDFLFLRPICEQLLTEGGYADFNVEAIYPAIDATSMQIGAGGWSAVEQWCLRNSGPQWEAYFDAPLFATSSNFDAIIIHLDGDVTEAPGKFQPQPTFANIVERVAFLNNWVAGMINCGPMSRNNLVHATPVMHMEAWILAGLAANVTNVENRSCKVSGKRLLSRHFSGHARSKVTQAALQICKNMTELRHRSASFVLFETDFRRKFPIT